jgi:hypothetical protein
MKKYPSIEQFRNVVRSVRVSHDYKGKDEQGNSIYSHTENYPVLKFIGTIKLHGTNASVIKYSDGSLKYQSRQRELSLQQDNCDFMLNMSKKDLSFIFDNFQYREYVAVYGEWCGGNIQKGVAISGLPKMFVIFGVKVDDEWVDLPKNIYNNEESIYNIFQFPTYEIDIDFNNPELSQNKLIEYTLQVEENCPVGNFFGKEGVGEGIVFTCETNPNLKFKSKGEKHSISKVKTLNSIDTEVLENINDFVEAVVTENRLNQGVNYLKEMGIEISSKATGDFLRWVVGDVMKEEGDTIVDNQLNVKQVSKAISNKARVWFLNNIEI